jgi:hypothetical protein
MGVNLGRLYILVPHHRIAVPPPVGFALQAGPAYLAAPPWSIPPVPVVGWLTYINRANSERRPLMSAMHEFQSFFCPTFLLPDDDPVEEEGLAQSRQGAKEEGNELREPILCAFAALR